MHHTLSQLSSLVGSFNTSLFKALTSTLPAKCWISSCSSSDAHHRFIWNPGDPPELQIGTLSDQPLGAAVLAVIDGQSEPEHFYNLVDHADDRELPVIVAVGINYGQGDWYAQHRGCGILQNTGMRGNVNGWLGRLALHKTLPAPIRSAALSLVNNGDFHLVIFNHFPLITAKSWSEDTAAHLQLFNGHSWGFVNPTREVDALATLLKPELILFHGKGALRRIAVPPSLQIPAALVSNIPGRDEAPEVHLHGKWV